MRTWSALRATWPHLSEVSCLLCRLIVSSLTCFGKLIRIRSWVKLEVWQNMLQSVAVLLPFDRSILRCQRHLRSIVSSAKNPFFFLERTSNTLEMLSIIRKRRYNTRNLSDHCLRLKEIDLTIISSKTSD